MTSIPPLLAERLADFCRAHYIQWLSFWGRSLEAERGRDGDLDVLVEFEPRHGPGYIGLVRLQKELSRVLGGRAVNLRTPREISPRFRSAVREGAYVLYEA